MDLAPAATSLARAERVVVLTGAGVSTDSGIPDFRGPNGVWTKNPAAERASNIEHYLADPEVRRAAWQHRLRAPIWLASPNRGHAAVVEGEMQGEVSRVKHGNNHDRGQIIENGHCQQE